MHLSQVRSSSLKVFMDCGFNIVCHHRSLACVEQCSQPAHERRKITPPRSLPAWSDVHHQLRNDSSSRCRLREMPPSAASRGGDCPSFRVLVVNRSRPGQARVVDVGSCRSKNPKNSYQLSWTISTWERSPSQRRARVVDSARNPRFPLPDPHVSPGEGTVLLPGIVNSPCRLRCEVLTLYHSGQARRKLGFVRNLRGPTKRRIPRFKMTKTRALKAIQLRRAD